MFNCFCNLPILLGRNSEWNCGLFFIVSERTSAASGTSSLHETLYDKYARVIQTKKSISARKQNR